MRILIADNIPAVRSAIRRLLNEEHGLWVVAEAANLGELVHLTRAQQPDLILLDWELSGLGGSTKIHPKTAPLTPRSDKKRNVILASLRQVASEPYIIVLSGHPEVEQTSIASGADAFVFKGDPPERLLLSIRALLDCRE